ncbi:MAG: 1,4-dihydroxy-2-naphthoate polyprenyltransferase [Corynebacterium sp.]|nr:1,4-dihydroxy-2-naphthoate polyprenyltransferase [Corynebacterium sp.]
MNFSDWWQGARPHTWSNAIAPVCAGTAVAVFYGGFRPGFALAALVVAWALIVGVNYANDYSDGIRGTDDVRTGPGRLTASGKVNPKAVKYAAFAFFGLAGVVGLVISILVAPWIILVGAVCILAAWFYTGGKNPYGYRGFGELAVFIFFGLVAVMGTEFIQRGTVSFLGLAFAVAIGAFSSSVNLVNNLRDIPEDKESGKITLAVRLGDARTRSLYFLLNAVPYVLTIIVALVSDPWFLVCLAALPLSVVAARPIRNGALAKELIPVLGLTGRAMLLWSVLGFLIAAL